MGNQEKTHSRIIPDTMVIKMFRLFMATRNAMLPARILGTDHVIPAALFA